jgi:hypothetical protein
MTDPVFATKWDFLFARVVLGVDRSTGTWSGSTSSQGDDMVCVWTSEALATEALHVESWALRQVAVRTLLATLPSGVGVVIDPERTSGMTCSPAYVASLKRYVEAFPSAEAVVRVGEWDLPSDVRDGLRMTAAGTPHLRALHAFVYSVDDSPLLGCLVYEIDEGCDADALTAELGRQLASAGRLPGPDLATVNMLSLAAVPEQVRATLAEAAYLVHPRKRGGFWRR